MKMLIMQRLGFWPEAEKIEQEVVDGVCGGYGIQTDDTRIRLFRPVRLGLSVLIRLRLLRKHVRVNQLVAP